MTKYILTERALIGNDIKEAGDEIEYDGLPSANMLPIDAEGEAKRKAAAEYDAKGRFVNPPPIERADAVAAEEAAKRVKAAVLKAKAKAKAGDDELV